jgi:hypothetical protein
MWFRIVLLCGLCGGLAAQDVVTRREREPLGKFAARLLPKGTEVAHSVLEGRFGPGPGNIVLLFRRTDDVNTNYTGWVLVPSGAGPGKYVKHVLPKMREIPGHFYIEVQAVFYANADADPAPELLVLYFYHRNGSQDDDSSATYVYRWTGSGFASLEAVERQLVGLKSAAAVRARLPRGK